MQSRKERELVNQDCQTEDELRREAHEEEAAGNQAATTQAHARSRVTNRRMAQVSCARLLQLLRGTGKPGQSMPVQGTCASPLGDSCPSPKFRPPVFSSLFS